MQDNEYTTPEASAPAPATPATPTTPATPATPDGVGEERVFSGERPAFDDAAHEITGLSCSKLDDLVVLGKYDISLD